MLVDFLVLLVDFLVLLVDFFFKFNATINIFTASISLYTQSGLICLLSPLEGEVGGTLAPLETNRISN